LFTTSVASAFACDAPGDNEQRAAGLRDLFEKREKIFQAGNLLLMDQDVSVLEDSFDALGIGHKVRRQVAFIELHALYHFKCGFDPFCLPRSRVQSTTLV
jgi:hypothetical protein